jgi:hypothetical protein
MIATAPHIERHPQAYGPMVGINGLSPFASGPKGLARLSAMRGAGQVNGPWPDPSWSIGFKATPLLGVFEFMRHPQPYRSHGYRGTDKLSVYTAKGGGRADAATEVRGVW